MMSLPKAYIGQRTIPIWNLIKIWGLLAASLILSCPDYCSIVFSEQLFFFSYAMEFLHGVIFSSVNALSWRQFSTNLRLQILAKLLPKLHPCTFLRQIFFWFQTLASAQQKLNHRCPNSKKGWVEIRNLFKFFVIFFWNLRRKRV